MKYLDQMNGFWNWRKLNGLTSKQADLYFALLDCANSAAWKSPFNAPNSTLQSMCQMSKTELHKNRNVLIQLGLIRYENGKKNSAGSYTIRPLYRTNSTTNSTTNVDTNPATNVDTNPGNIPRVRRDKDKTLTLASKSKHTYGEYGWVKLTEGQYADINAKYGAAEAGRAIRYVDESAQSTGNKNGWKDWNLIVCKCIRDGWGKGVKGKAQPNVGPEGVDREADYEKILAASMKPMKGKT